MKDSKVAKWNNNFNKLSDKEKEKVLKENKEYIIKNLIKPNDCVIGIISQYCSCFDDGKISYYFNLKDSKKLYIYYIKSEEEEKIFKEGNTVSFKAHIEHNSYIVDSITLIK